MSNEFRDMDVNQQIGELMDRIHDLREKWSSALRAAHQAISPPPYPPR